MAEVESELPADLKREHGAATDLGGRTRSGDRPGNVERLHPLIELTLSRVREFIREPEAVFWVFIFPVLLAFALGIAFRNTAPQEIRIAVEDGGLQADSNRATEIAGALSRSPEIEATVLSPEAAAKALRTGKIALIVRTQSGRWGGAASEAGSATLPELEYRFDPTRPESRIARLTVDDALQRELGRNDVVGARDETVTEPGARYIDFLIPGLIGLNLMGSGMWGLGFAVVQARTRKLLKRLAATPMRRSHYLLSFMLSRMVFLFLEVAAVVVFAWLVFKVNVQGSMIDLAIVAVIGAVTFAGIGLLVASRPKTIEGVSGWMNLVMLPMWLVSGTFFSASRFPDFLQPLIKALPLTALNDSLRAVMNEGASISSSWPQVAVLVAWGLVSFAIALRIFRWQ
ncbi:MAG TPA: ABC transporter permease [Blastocatellia bacterium]|nr:ABC transporter permease [Blastocatellia bacterium]